VGRGETLKASQSLKGRYAFRQAFEGGQYLVTRMEDSSALVEKRDIHLKNEEFLNTVSQSDRPISVEWRDDGSLANVAIHNLRAVYTAAIGRRDNPITISSQL